MKKCSRCGLQKPLDQFYDGRAACKPCFLADRRRRYRQDGQIGTKRRRSVSSDMSLAEAAATEDELQLLVAIRKCLAEALDDEKTHVRDIAPLTRRLLEVVRDIDALQRREDPEEDEQPRVPDQPWSEGDL